MLPVEASPHRPGRVGHTPQPVGSILRANRRAGILSSQLALVMPREYTTHVLPQPQRFGTTSQTVKLLDIEAMRARKDPRQPWPQDFKAGLDPSLTRAPR